MLRRLSRYLCPLSHFAILILLSASALATDWSTPVQQLAQQIAGTTGPGAVSLEISNQSSLNKADVDAVGAELRNRLGALGLRFVPPDQAAATVRVTLSENVQGYVWVAKSQQGNAPPTVAIVSSPRADTNLAVHEPAVLLIRKIQLWSQADRILDVGVIDSSPPQIVVLDPAKITLYMFQSNRWVQQQAFPVTHGRPWPRDLRGRVVLRKDHLFDAYLPGTVCSANNSMTLACRDSDDPWPVGNDLIGLNAFFSSNRNFFTGALSPGIGKQTVVSGFYSAAPLPREKYVLWILGGTDGQVHEADGFNDQALPRLGWGSDIASVKTSCGSGTQVLAVSNSDGTATDAIRAFEVPDRDPVPVSQPVDLNGPVTSLWTETSGTGAVLVSRNLQTGRYEAFRLAITCGQ